MRKIPHRIYLTEEFMPKEWYNMRADIGEIPPMLNPATLKPVTVDDLSAVFTKAAAEQELDDKSEFVPIPDEVRDRYFAYRPSPLVRAYNLEKALDTPAKIYYKHEGNNTSGSHKLNSALAQAYYAKEQGIKSLMTETGAGQWGTALSEACANFGLNLTVFMIKSSVAQKPYRKIIMETLGSKVIPSPSMTTEAGKKILEADPESSGSLGCAISEAVEASMRDDNARYALGSVLHHVVLHQSVIGLESKIALEMHDEYPDIVIGCAGGGSNLAGLIAPFVRDKIKGSGGPRIIAVEPASCPSLTRGKYAYDFCDVGKVTPLTKMYTLGSGFMPSPNHAGGLRYHGMSQIVSKLYADGLMEAVAYGQAKVFESAVYFAKNENILPAPESAHAVSAAIDEALECKKTGEAKTILFGLTGLGHFDLAAYSNYNDKTLSDGIPTDEDLAASFANLPNVEH